MERWELTPDKFEMDNGMLFLSDEEPLTLPALLLEHAGIDKAIGLGDPLEQRKAIAELDPK